MRFLYAAAAALLIAGPGARAEEAPRISGPVTHQNLSIYFVHGPSAPGPVPLTLAEALDKGAVEVIETGSVNELKIRNKGNEAVFVQSGEIVKGGQQDRVITVSFVLPPKSGDVPLAAFCVEHGRWSARGNENVTKFTSAAEAMPSREAKIAMKVPSAPTAGNRSQPSSLEPAQTGRSDTGERQQKVWNEVARTQSKLSGGLKQAVESSVSATSLQLSLENAKLKDMRGGYIAALEAAGKGGDDIVGYVFAINGRINSADLYPSNALFRKMWGKQLAAAVTEAIGESEKTASAPAAPPTIADVQRFLTAAEKPKPSDEEVAGLAKQQTRNSEEALFVGVQTPKGDWIHRSYLKH